jgi:excisionase family DNA binding protein
VVAVVEEKGEVWLTPKEAARRLRVSRRSLYDLIEGGRLQAKEKRSLTGRRRFWLLPLSEVERLQRLREEGTSEGA